jgi:anti-sigma-K factor RskA
VLALGLIMNESPISDETKELAAGYVLDELEASERADFEQQLKTDIALRQEVRELQIALGGLSVDVPQLTPPSHLRAKTLASLGVVDEQSEQSSEQSIVPKKKIDWGKILAIFALLASAALLWDNLRLRQDLSFAQQQTSKKVTSLLQRPNSKLVSLTDPASGAAGGTILFTPGKWQEVVLSAQNLPPLPADQVYRLWLSLNNQQTIYCGEFQTDRQGRVSRSIQPPQVPPPGTKATGLFVTVERQDAAVSPTGTKVMSGEI